MEYADDVLEGIDERLYHHVVGDLGEVCKGLKQTAHGVVEEVEDLLEVEEPEGQTADDLSDGTHDGTLQSHLLEALERSHYCIDGRDEDLKREEDLRYETEAEPQGTEDSREEAEEIAHKGDGF